jgi:hypothetical protein
MKEQTIISGTILPLIRFPEQRGMLNFKTSRLRQKSKGYLRVFALTIFGLLFATSACELLFGRDDSLPAFNGVTTEFTLTLSRIKTGEQLEVHAVFHNTRKTTQVFRFLDFGVNARLYSNGNLLEDSCEALDYPVQSLELKPGEIREITDKVFTTSCYKLAPGRYSIRFNYDLGLLQDEMFRKQFREKYNDPPDAIVPWDRRDHPFTVVK